MIWHTSSYIRTLTSTQSQQKNCTSYLYVVIQAHSTMKLLTGLLGGFLLICSLQQPSLAAPGHVKRDQKYVKALFDVYGCRVVKAASLVT